MVVEFSIVLLTYNRSDLVDDRLDELLRLPLKSLGAEVVVVDNASNDGTLLVLQSYRERFEQAGMGLLYNSYLIPHGNKGFAGGFNFAVSKAAGKYIALLSNDVRVFGDFVTPVMSELSEGRKIVAREVVSHPAGWNRFGSATISWPNGYFLAMRRSDWEELGGFDEGFTPHDYEDVDLGYRAQRAGIELVQRSDLPVEHLVAQTIGYSPERYDHTVAMRARFAEKHNLPNIPERP